MTASSSSLYEQVLAAQLERPPAAPRPPRPSAAVVPWRRRAGRLEVYWVQRSESVPFMPGWHAFPGGALGRGDAALPVLGEPEGVGDLMTEAPAGSPLAGEESGPDLVPGLLAGALRELFEETGLLLTSPSTAEVELGAERRRAMAADPGELARGLVEIGAALDASALVYAGRWLTPPFAPLRFDNRFFLLCWPLEHPQQPRVEPGELAAGEWIEPRAALERWRAGGALAAPPILHLLTVLAEDGPEGGLRRLRHPPSLGPFRRIEFRPGVLLLPLRTPTLPPATHTNAYLLGSGPAVLVDPGSPYADQQEVLLSSVRAAGAELGREVSAVWLTHHHPDHVGGATAAAAALGVPIAAHPATAERLAARGVRVDQLLHDGEEHQLGDLRVRVLHTPGHARGHLCFLVEADGALLCGDLMSALSTIVVDPPEGHMGDYLASLERTAALAPRFLLPAHGPVLRHGRRLLAELVAHRRGREERIAAAWLAGRREPDQLIDAAYDELAPELRPVAARQVEAHLEHLREQGRLPTPQIG